MSRNRCAIKWVCIVGAKFRNFRNGDKWYGNISSLGEVLENTEIVKFPKSEPFNPKFRDESQMERKFSGKNFFENLVIPHEVVLLQILNFLLSASWFFWPPSQRVGHLTQG